MKITEKLGYLNRRQLAPSNRPVLDALVRCCRLHKEVLGFFRFDDHDLRLAFFSVLHPHGHRIGYISPAVGDKAVHRSLLRCHSDRIAYKRNDGEDSVFANWPYKLPALACWLRAIVFALAYIFRNIASNRHQVNRNAGSIA